MVPLKVSEKTYDDSCAQRPLPKMSTPDPFRNRLRGYVKFGGRGNVADHDRLRATGGDRVDPESEQNTSVDPKEMAEQVRKMPDGEGAGPGAPETVEPVTGVPDAAGHRAPPPPKEK